MSVKGTYYLLFTSYGEHHDHPENFDFVGQGVYSASKETEACKDFWDNFDVTSFGPDDLWVYGLIKVKLSPKELKEILYYKVLYDQSSSPAKEPWYQKFTDVLGITTSSAEEELFIVTCDDLEAIWVNYTSNENYDDNKDADTDPLYLACAKEYYGLGPNDIDFSNSRKETFEKKIAPVYKAFMQTNIIKANKDYSIVFDEHRKQLFKICNDGTVQFCWEFLDKLRKYAYDSYFDDVSIIDNIDCEIRSDIQKELKEKQAIFKSLGIDSFMSQYDDDKPILVVSHLMWSDFQKLVKKGYNCEIFKVKDSDKHLEIRDNWWKNLNLK